RWPQEGKHVITLWDVQAGKALAKIENTLSEAADSHLQFSPDSALLCVQLLDVKGQTLEIQVWDVASGTCLWTQPPTDLRGDTPGGPWCKFTDDSTFLCVPTGRPTAPFGNVGPFGFHVMEARTGQERHAILTDHTREGHISGPHRGHFILT